MKWHIKRPPPSPLSPTKSRFPLGKSLFPQAPRNNDKTSKPSDIGQVVSNTLVFALALVEKISECAPVPGLKGAVGGLRLFLDRFDVSKVSRLFRQSRLRSLLQDVEQNLHGYDDLVISIDNLNSILFMFEDTSSLGRGLTDDLGEQLFMLSG
jgi:hypothetical protein